MQIGANFKATGKGIKAHKRAERVETGAPRLEHAILTVFYPSVIISIVQKEQNQ